MAHVSLTADHEKINYLNNGHTWKSWLFTLDHKRIGILYLLSITFFFFLGAVMASLMRAELVTPQGDLVSSDTYNRLFTGHGVMMIFFFLIPSIPAVLGNFCIPIMIGAKDVAFPRINLASWYVFMLGAGIVLYATLKGGVDTGWTFYTPYSTMYSNSNVVLAIVGVFVTGFSSIMTGLNFAITIHKMRAPGLTWFRLPLFIWAMYATSLIFLLGTPVIAITLLLLFLERVLGFGIFNPKLGGDPVLFQHLFWFYSHPAVYIMILPGMGVISELTSCFSKKRIFGYSIIAISSLAIAVVGFFVWGHHLFLSSQSIYAGMVFSFLSMLVAIPSAIKIFNWMATLFKGTISFKTPMLYCLGFMGLFTIGGLTGVFLATMAIDIHLHDTYYIVAHFHYVMVGGAITAFFGGLHFWWPKMMGRMYPEKIGQVASFIIFIGFNLTFYPQFIMGFFGMPRRYHHYPPEFQFYHILSTLGALMLGIGLLMIISYLIWSLFYGEKAPSNPWGAKGLEWEKTPSPPPTENFEKTPVVTEEAYAYH